MGGSSDKKADEAAVGGKSARACDGCMKRRARWYCAADDAFLCQSCDTSVHSANPLARRHERLRLRATSTSPLHAESMAEAATTMTKTSSKRLRVAPAWLKRKARTRRPPVKSVGQLLSRRLVVPEEGAGESSDERRATEEEQLLYRVPIFDPALGEFSSPPPIDDGVATASGCREDVDGAVDDPNKEGATAPSPVHEFPDCFASFGPTDAELREFAADMEALLGQGLDDSSELGDSFYMEALGLLSPAGDSGRVKVEAEAGGLVSRSNGMLASGPEMKPEFNRSPPTLVDDDDSFEHKTSSASNCGDAVDDAQFLKRSLDLRLNYEAVIESWGSSPWTDGQRPQGGQLDDLLLHDHSAMWTAGGGGRQGEAAWTPRPRADGWREARVSRYREKRRTRLFAKKIRYEVRKLNAEKRPRMKGRFVKRTGAALAAAPPCAVT